MMLINILLTAGQLAFSGYGITETNHLDSLDTTSSYTPLHEFTSAQIDSIQSEYTSLCLEIKDKRESFARLYANSSALKKAEIKKEAKEYLEPKLLEVLSMWDRTLWSMEGSTKIPNPLFSHPSIPPDKMISCGHYVGLPLSQIGFQFEGNSYSLGKQFPENIAKTLGKKGTYVDEVSTLDSMVNYFKNNSAEEGIYIGGVMGNISHGHIGWIIKNSNGTYFRHARPNIWVLEEKLEKSTYLNNAFEPLVFAKFDWDRLMDNWLNQGKINIINEPSKYDRKNFNLELQE